MRTAASHRSGIRCHRAKSQSQAVEYPAVGVMHRCVCFLQAVTACVKRISVFHDEFTGAHDAEAGPDFVAEFGLNLVKGQWQLTVAFNLPPSDVGNDLLMSRAKA